MNIEKTVRSKYGTSYFVTWRDMDGEFRVKTFETSDLIDFIEDRRLNEEIYDEYDPFALGGHKQTVLRIDPHYYLEDRLTFILKEYIRCNLKK